MTTQQTLERPALRADAVVGRELPHESARLHVTGAAAYTDDLPEVAGTLHMALGLSPVAHGRLVSIDTTALAAMPGVVRVLTAADFAAWNDCGPIIHDDPILAQDTVRYVGQPVFAVVACTRAAARMAARQVAQHTVIEPLPAVLSVRQAHALQQYVVAPMRMQRGDTHAALAQAPHRVQGSWEIGGQEQFYLEGQISYAVPKDDGGMLVYCSTQHPSEMQHMVAHALSLSSNQVQVQCRRMGGGFGGKESQSAQFACLAARAAQLQGVAVKLRLDRDDDFMVTGRRHGFCFDWDLGFDEHGRILGIDATLIANAGHSADLSAPVVTRAMCHLDNAYFLPAVDIKGYAARTNTQSNTAFRGFGGPQGALLIEYLMDNIARQLGLDPVVVRARNYYGSYQGDAAGAEAARALTPYGQPVVDNVMPALSAQLLQSSNYESRRAACAAFNANSPVLKKGLAFTPVKFGISFNVSHFNQAGALVHIYTDGSVLVNHGGTEMGQGLNTKVAMVVAHELGLPLSQVRCTATDTEKVANTSATAASTGTDLNGKAAQDAARQLRERLAAFYLQSQLPQHAVPADSEAAVVFAQGQVQAPGLGPVVKFEDLVQQAYVARVQLWSDGFYATPGLHWNRETMTGEPFYYFAYGAAVSEVVVDTLTGEWRLLRADLLHDVGRSLNPALDIGQVEGAYIQGMGWLTLEELVWHPERGTLLTHAPSTYKIPTANDMPVEFHTALFDNANVKDAIHRSKAVGEPPLLLGFSALLALRDAVSAVANHRVDPPLTAPATPESILRAVQAVKAHA